MDFLRKKTPLELWNLHKEDFLKIYAHEQSKPLTHAMLEECYLDRKGKRYYRCPDSIAIPIERMGKINQIMEWISRSIDGSELKQFTAQIHKALEDGFTDKSKKSAARIGSLVMQMEERENMIIHTELLYNLLAAHWIREDEAPEVYNNEIQMQKVEQFKEEVAHGNSYFFFQQKELKKFYDYTNFTEQEWHNYWQESLAKQAALKQSLEVYSKV